MDLNQEMVSVFGGANFAQCEQETYAKYQEMAEEDIIVKLQTFLNSASLLEILKRCAAKYACRFIEYRTITIRLKSGKPREITSPVFLRAKPKRGERGRTSKRRKGVLRHFALELLGMSHKISPALMEVCVSMAINQSNLRKILLSLKGEGSRWPRDEEFVKSCTSSDLYPGGVDARKMRAILAELEYQLREDARAEDFLNTDLGHLDIDHILPKSWYKYWPLPDGEIANSNELSAINLKKLIGSDLNEREHSILTREDLVKTLGNLTLLNLSVNREAQNKGFSVKKQLLLQNTNLRLNVALLGLDEWDEDAIRNRGKILANAAIHVWPGEKAEQTHTHGQ